MATSIQRNDALPLPASEDDDSAKSGLQAAKENQAGHSWTVWNRRNRESKPVRHLRKEFDGGSGRRYPYSFRKPKRELDEKVIETYDLSSTGAQVNADGKRAYRNPFGMVIWKYEDVDTYLSPSNYAPRRLMVQATDSVLQQHTGVTWRRSKAHGNVPVALRMAEWAVGPETRWFSSAWRLPIVALPLQLLLALPGSNAPWEVDDIEDKYLDYVGYYWKWPKHATNPLDMGVRAGSLETHRKPDMLSSKKRLLRPRQLVVLRDGKWNVDTNPSPHFQYLFISWTWSAFSKKDENGNDDGSGLEKACLMAEYMTLQAGLSAYWLDRKCNAPKTEPELLTADVNRMCDVIRGSKYVAVLLPDDASSRMEEWGQRMWTLPEGLLAPGDLHICIWHGKDSYEVRTMGKVEMTSEYWKDESDEAPARILAEHYAGTITLSRLELLSTAITALSHRASSHDFTGADMAYAFMGLLHYRIEPDSTDDIFQLVARLSLANDNDRLIERMVAMFPTPTANIRDLFKVLGEMDQYNTHLWDVKPRCEVVGVGDEPNTVILNECRAVPIRWKRFPRMSYKRHKGMKKTIAELAVRSGAFWIITGYSLAFTYAPFFISGANPDRLYTYLGGIIAIFIGVGLLLACLAPHAVLRLFGGAVLETAPHLVGLEGTMPIDQLEKMIFGDSQGRLTYEPSSTPFGFDNRDPELRLGREPAWIRDSRPEDASPPIRKGHHIFTLVDSGNLTVSIFQAKKPPTVALICGAEGGMLRAVLCSWRFANDCLYKETVIRVPTSTWEQTKLAGWLKVSLDSQADLVYERKM